METTHILNEEIEDEDSFFDLVIKSDYNVINVKASNLITPLRSIPKLKVFILGFKSKPDTKPSKDTPVFIKNNSLNTRMHENSNFEASCDVVSSMKQVPKYLKLIKPFYSKSFSKKSKVTPSCSTTPGRLSEESRKRSFKFVANKLVKSRSTSAVVMPELRRRDDTLLEQHDGIQGAILHCKKSYSSSSSSSSCHDQKRSSI